MNTTEITILLYQHRHNEQEIANIFKTKRKLLLKLAKGWPDGNRKMDLLGWAASRGYTIIVDYILKDPKFYPSGVTDFVWVRVIQNGHILCAYQLAHHFAFYQMASKFDLIRVAMTSIQFDAKYIAIVNLLLELDPSLLFSDHAQQHYPLHWAIYLSLYDTVDKFYNTDEVNVRAQDGQFEGQTPLIVAAIKLPDDSTIPETLILAGASVDDTDKSGYTAFMHAVFHQKYNMARTLLNYGASVDKKIDHKKRTMLTVAARNGRVQNIQFLLSVGAQVDMLDADSATPLQHALMNRQVLAAKCLIRACSSLYFNNFAIVFCLGQLLSKWPDNMQSYKDLLSREISRTRYNKSYLLLINKSELFRSLPLEIACYIHAYLFSGNHVFSIRQ